MKINEYMHMRKRCESMSLKLEQLINVLEETDNVETEAILKVLNCSFDYIHDSQQLLDMIGEKDIKL